LENFSARYPLETAVAPPRVLAASPLADRTTIFLPFSGPLTKNGLVESWSEFARLNVDYMNFAAPRLSRIVNGYSGQRSKLKQEFPRGLAGFPDRRSIYALSSIAGLSQIVFDARFLQEFDETSFLVALEEFPENLALLARGDDRTFLIGLTPIDRPNPQRLIYPNDGQEKVALDMISNQPLPATEDLKVWLDGSPVANPLKKIIVDGRETVRVEIPLDTAPRVRPYRVLVEGPEGEPFRFR
jgi:hypothetical protein